MTTSTNPNIGDLRIVAKTNGFGHTYYFLEEYRTSIYFPSDPFWANIAYHSYRVYTNFEDANSALEQELELRQRQQKLKITHEEVVRYVSLD